MSAATTSEERAGGVFASAAEMGAYLASKDALRSRHEEVEEYARREGREWTRLMSDNYVCRPTTTIPAGPSPY